VVEDDYDGEFRYDRRPLGAMQALAPDDVVYGGTASKALAPAGLHAVVELPAGHSEEEAVAEARRRGLAVEGLAAFAVAGHARAPALVVGYATPPAHAFTTALARLVATLRAL
jgi:GntR family transcriptional regulator/MocR family aminotransferase